MSLDNVRAFISKVREDEGLQQQMGSLHADNPVSSIVEIGKSSGFDFTAEEVRQVLREEKGEGQEELSEEGLDLVSGGIIVSNAEVYCS